MGGRNGMPEIVSVQNPRVKEWQQLLERKGRERQGLFLVEGVHLVQEALRHAADVRVVAYSRERGIPEELSGFAAEAGDGGEQPEWIAVSEPVLTRCTDARTPQAVFAVVAKPSGAAPALLDLPDALVVAVDGVQDPGNLGTIIRSADSVGASGVVLGSGTVDLYNPKTLRATMGSLFHLPVIEADLSEVLEQARARGAQLVGTSLQADEPCYAADFRGATWFVVGNEGRGVSPLVAGLVSRNVIIPMHGKAESLNVAMAATVLLYEALRQRRYSNNNNSCPSPK